MFSKRFSRKKSSRVYHVAKSGKFAKLINAKVCHRKSKIPENYKPMAVQYLKYLMKTLKRSIKVWSNGKIIYSCGNNLKKPSIEVKYLQNRLQCTDDNLVKIGHFVLKSGKDASTDKSVPNDCLFQVISAQCGIRPDRLQREITRKLRKLKSGCGTKNFFYRDVPESVNVDILGGARYNGTSENDAKRVLDLSQSGKSHPDREAGHPRGHASYPQASGIKESVENYSKTRDRRGRIRRKTGFFSRSDQDFVAHYVLENNDTQDAIELLNERGKDGLREVVKIPAKKLTIFESKLPKVQDWLDGKKIGDPGRINRVVVVIKHFYKKYEDEKADVFILTLYPEL